MLFVNEELEENHPIFSEPKKVLPTYEDEMARRIKTMLGDYVHEEESDICDYKDDRDRKNAAQSIPSSFLTDPNSLKSKNSEEEMLTKQVDCENVEEKEFCPLDESTNSVNMSVTEEDATDKNAQAEPCGISARRSSLKRQCKEKISLLDYNPMFTIRNKRIKTNSSSQRSRGVKHSEENKSLRLDLAGMHSSSNGFSNSFNGNTGRSLNDISMEEKYSESSKYESYSNDEMDEPPLLDPVSLTSDKNSCDGSEMLEITSSSYKDQYEYMTDNREIKSQSIPNEANYDDSVSKESFLSQAPVNSQVKVKSKKQSKKKKKKLLYESSTVSEDNGNNSSFNGGDSLKQSTESTVGSCQIKNGIIKIRLSKLIDNKKDIGENDYEVSLCESDALIGCKTLSVPLSPLAPAVYSAYCANLKTKKKSHSKKSKKKGKKNGPFKEVVDKVENKEEVHIDTFLAQESSELCEPPNSNNIDCEFSETNEEKTENILETANVQESLPASIETVNSDSCTTELRVNMDYPSNTLHEETSAELENISVNSQNSIPVQPSVSPNSHMGNTLCSSNLDVPSQLNGTEILCSINLALLDRVPEKLFHPTNHGEQSHSNMMDGKIVKEENVFNSVHSIVRNGVSQGSFIAGKNSNVIKKERYTPPVCELSRIEMNGAENTNSPVNNIHEISEDEACPNLIPAYSIDSPREVRNKLNNFVSDCEKDDHQGTKLVTIQNDSIPILQRDVCDRMEPPVFINNTHFNKIKLESSENLVSNHEKWTEFKDYRWCREYTDLNYNGNTLFKEQYTINNHRLWQDPDLKKPYSSEYYLSEAKKLKHQADKEVYFVGSNSM